MPEAREGLKSSSLKQRPNAWIRGQIAPGFNAIGAMIAASFFQDEITPRIVDHAFIR